MKRGRHGEIKYACKSKKREMAKRMSLRVSTSEGEGRKGGRGELTTGTRHELAVESVLFPSCRLKVSSQDERLEREHFLSVREGGGRE